MIYLWNVVIARKHTERQQSLFPKTVLNSNQDGIERSPCEVWDYDQSEFYDTVVTEENWVCEKVNGFQWRRYSVLFLHL